MTNKKKNPWVLRLFGLPFLAVGVFMLYSIAKDANIWYASQSWIETQAEIIHLDIKWSHNSDGASTAKCVGEYHYLFRDLPYQSDRIAISGGSDNLGDFHQDLFGRLKKQQAHQGHVIAFVNPQDPSQAILDRTWRWPLFLFRMVFVLVFGGFGLGVWIGPPIYEFYKKRRSGDPNDDSKEPWQRVKDWDRHGIYAKLNPSFYFHLVFTAFWSAIAFPISFFVFSDKHADGAAYIVAIFPLVGIGMIIHLIIKFIRYWAHRSTHIILNPFPGSIGGKVAGSVCLPTNIKQMKSAQFKLTCLNIYWRKSGKNNSLVEDILWTASSEQTTFNHGLQGLEIPFKFLTPSDCPESSTDRGFVRKEWRLNVTIDIDGLDIVKEFALPVFITESTQDLKASDIRDENEHRDDSLEGRCESLKKAGYRVEHDRQNLFIQKPFWSSLISSIPLLIFSVFWNSFIAVFFFVAKDGFVTFFLIPFALIGLLMLFATIMSAFSAFTWTFDRQDLHVNPHLLKSSFSLNLLALGTIEKKSNSSSGNTKYYKIFSKHDGKKKDLAHSIKGEEAADDLIDIIKIWKRSNS